MQFKLILLIVLAVTVGSLGMVASKISSAIGGSKIPSIGLEIPGTTPTVTLEPTAIPVVASIDLTEIEEVRKTRTVGKCVITLFAQKYDVTEPNKLGNNGDLFDCGKDMSSIYMTKYGKDVTKMLRFLVTTPTLIPVANTSVIPTSIKNPEISIRPKPTTGSIFNFKEDNDEREDREHEDRYEKPEVEPTEIQH